MKEWDFRCFCCACCAAVDQSKSEIATYVHEITVRTRVITFSQDTPHTCMTSHEGFYSSVTLPLLPYHYYYTTPGTWYCSKLLLTTATSPSTAAVHPFLSIAISYLSFEFSCTGIGIIQHFLFMCSIMCSRCP